MLRCGMPRSFQKNQHPNSNLKIQQTQNAAPLIKERVLNKFSTLLYPGARASLKDLAGIQILGPNFFTTGTLRRRYNESVPEGNLIQDLAVNGPVNDFR